MTEKPEFMTEMEWELTEEPVDPPTDDGLDVAQAMALYTFIISFVSWLVRIVVK